MSFPGQIQPRRSARTSNRPNLLREAWLPYEFDALRIPLGESRARYEAPIDAVLRLWTEEKVTEQTPLFSYQDVTSLPPSLSYDDQTISNATEHGSGAGR
ncbi:hypothetical protein [Kutzneria sp. NPDC052558]|uniref:hypothetical protein n=1 Tax=Kutzneria sp. NPDC052558 TaxID=3364121 RepID=UPI0037CB3C37